LVLPNFLNTTRHSWLAGSGINLGLDLQGGAHLLLSVDTDSYFNESMENTLSAIRAELRQNKIAYSSASVKDAAGYITIKNKNWVSEAIRLINKLDKNLEIKTKASNKLIIEFSDHKLSTMKDDLISRSREIVRMRIDEMGTKEPSIQRQGSDNILLQVPGMSDPSHLKELLGRTARLSFNIVDEKISAQEALRGNLPRGEMLTVKENDALENGLVVKKKPIITGDLLEDANATFDQYNNPVVSFSLNSLGARQFATATKQYSRKRMAIILDNKLIQAPKINEPILGGTSMISGSFSLESAKDLALLLRAGALPAPIKIVEERNVGPSLGQDSIAAGKKAGIIGFVGVVAFMIWSYSILGVIASVALVLALTYILAMLSLLQATLTLPGIAGIILTIGMAVDANVLIYERIKEELSQNISVPYGISRGFEFAMATITDSNITTVIAALLLYIFGTGAIKGFAVTLIIGIIASMFSAIIITRVLLDLWSYCFKPRKLNI
jgi:preprotein translocase subunit SecD